MLKQTSQSLTQAVIKTLGIQVVMIFVALLFCWLFCEQNPWLAVLYGGGAGMVITAYLGLNLLHKTAKASRKGEQMLAIKGLGIVQVSRYALTLCAFYFGIKLELDTLPMVASFAWVQTAFWFVLIAKRTH